MKKKIVFLLAAVLMMAGCREKGGEDMAEQKDFETMTIAKSDITLSQNYPASIEGRQSVKIIPRVENSGWETHKIQYGLKIIYVTLRAKEVDYDKEMIKTVKQPWYAYKFVKYEVKPNSYGIEEIWYIKNKGWFVAGDKLELWRVYS